MWTYHQQGLVAFTWGQFLGKCFRYNPSYVYQINKTTTFLGANELNLSKKVTWMASKSHLTSSRFLLFRWFTDSKWEAWAKTCWFGVAGTAKWSWARATKCSCCGTTKYRGCAFAEVKYWATRGSRTWLGVCKARNLEASWGSDSCAGGLWNGKKMAVVRK